MTTTLPPARPDTYGTDPGDPGRARTIGGVGELLDPEDVTQFVQEAFSTADEVVGFSGSNKYYFLGQWEEFKQQPWVDLAHSTHLRVQGTWDAEHGERNRVTVTLATGIPEEVVRAVNLNYLDPASVDIDAYQADPDTFVVPHAGEVLYRLRPGQRREALGEPDGRGPSIEGWDG
jgi:hypothetical protein